MGEDGAVLPVADGLDDGGGRFLVYLLLRGLLVEDCIKGEIDLVQQHLGLCGSQADLVRLWVGINAVGSFGLIQSL